MRTIETPDDVVLRDVADKVLMCFEEFLLGAIRQHEPFGHWPGLRQASKIMDAVDAGGIELEDADYEALKTAVEQAKWHPIVAPQLLPFYEAMGFE